VFLCGVFPLEDRSATSGFREPSQLNTPAGGGYLGYNLAKLDSLNQCGFGYSSHPEYVAHVMGLRKLLASFIKNQWLTYFFLMFRPEIGLYCVVLFAFLGNSFITAPFI